MREFLHRCPAVEDQVVAILDLREERTMLAAGPPALRIGDERGERGEPFLAALQEIASRQFLQPRRVAAPQEGIGGLVEIDALFAHPDRQPVMLVELD
ncbi:MAG: hypothetical protein J2P48_13640, partial [Alphaproteobacteria bacterium]|nr:hypothetical protein [Alphaproteobacteria bacterium]